MEPEGVRHSKSGWVVGAQPFRGMPANAQLTMHEHLATGSLLEGKAIPEPAQLLPYSMVQANLAVSNNRLAYPTNRHSWHTF